MNNTDISNTILHDAARITSAIETGAAWELWAQVELHILFRQLPGVSVARELPYPASNQTLDFGLAEQAGRYAIELKVESATNAGTALIHAVETDITKIAAYGTGDGVPLTRWVVAVGYSDAAKGALAAFVATRPAGSAIYSAQNLIGVLVATV